MRLIFPTKPNINYPWGNIFKTFNVSWGTESLSHLGPKIWNIIPLELKKLRSLAKFKKSIRLWKPEKWHGGAEKGVGWDGMGLLLLFYYIIVYSRLHGLMYIVI